MSFSLSTHTNKRWFRYPRLNSWRTCVCIMSRTRVSPSILLFIVLAWSTKHGPNSKAAKHERPRPHLYRHLGNTPSPTKRNRKETQATTWRSPRTKQNPILSRKKKEPISQRPHPFLPSKSTNKKEKQRYLVHRTCLPHPAQMV